MQFKKNLLRLAATITIVCSCNKNKLDQPALGQLDESKLTNRKGVENLLIGAYALLDGFSADDKGVTGGWGSAASNWIYGSIAGSEAYTGTQQGDQLLLRAIENFTHNKSNSYFNEKWAAVYAGVQRANDVLRVMKKAKDIKPDDEKRIAGEARFLRAHYHFEAIKMWNKVPFVDESVTYESGNYYLPNDTLIWPAIERDFQYAMDNLPAVQTAPGRANKYAAEAFLAKAYMFQRKFAVARPLLQDLIANGVTASGKPYALVNYADNFNAATKNGPEAVFAVQMSVNDGGSAGDNPGNGNLGDVLNFPFGGGPGTCCGFFQPSQYLVNHYKTDAATGLPDLDNFNDVEVKSDQGLQTNDPFSPYAGTLDPRLDWTVGRRGIPYLDWGLHPGWDWIRDQPYSGPYTPIKNVYYKNQAGILSTNNFWTFGLTANNVNLIRFADILLWAAEVEVEIGSIDQAEAYVNMVRNRMTNPDGWVHTYIDNNDPSKGFTNIPAANYFVKLYPPGDFVARGQNYARKAVRYERMLELAMEGHRFFDLVRWGIAETEINKYFEKEKTRRTYLIGANFIKPKNEYFPIPQTEIDKSVGPDGVRRLKQNPGY